jgi:hypothetical protein
MKRNAPAEPSQKKTEKKGTEKAQGEKTEKGKKSGLRPAQVKVLELLKKGDALTRTQMYSALETSAGLNGVLGYNDPERRARADQEGYPSLLTLGYIRIKEAEVDGRKTNVYEITPKGKAALEVKE